MTWSKIWAWFKKYWKWILFPIGILFMVATVASRFMPGFKTFDVTQRADERAKLEKERRDAELAAENQKLQERLAQVRAENQHKLEVLTESQMQQAAELEGDPEALNEWLRSL